MKIHILHKIQDGPWGGGNQFLKALRDEWRQQQIYCEKVEDADVVIMNSYPFREEELFDQVYRIKKMRPNTIIVYRLNGPISHIRQTDKEVDRMIALFNKFFADGIIFQSNWCAKENKKYFGIDSHYQTVIYNAPDKNIFHKQIHSHRDLTPTKLIATSWSANPRKGFDVYAYLDEHLDFSKYEMTFVGNSPIKFKQIKKIDSVSSEILASLLQQNDLFITASKTDPCSNSLIEALSCGLPAVALNDGGHPELVQKGGELFNGTSDVLEKIDKVTSNYAHYQSHLPTFDLSDVAHQYYAFCKKIWRDAEENRYTPKRNRFIGLLLLKKHVFVWKIKTKLRSVLTLFKT